MAKANSFVMKMQRQLDERARVQREFTIQQMEDMMLIMLNDSFGFGAQRLLEARDALRSTLTDYAKLCVEDGKNDRMIEYTKEVIDRRLRAIMGDDYPKWEERYRF